MPDYGTSRYANFISLQKAGHTGLQFFGLLLTIALSIKRLPTRSAFTVYSHSMFKLKNVVSLCLLIIMNNLLPIRANPGSFIAEGLVFKQASCLRIQ
jgi:hypothetical protein